MREVVRLPLEDFGRQLRTLETKFAIEEFRQRRVHLQVLLMRQRDQEMAEIN